MTIVEEMKASDSANSLSELVPDDCFICMDNETNKWGEPVVSSKLLRNCGCKFFVHPRCWNEWLKGKSDWDCPICHKQSITRIPIRPNPVLEIHITDETPRWNYRKIGCGLLTLSLISFGAGMIISSMLQ